MPNIFEFVGSFFPLYLRFTHPPESCFLMSSPLIHVGLSDGALGPHGTQCLLVGLESLCCFSCLKQYYSAFTPFPFVPVCLREIIQLNQTISPSLLPAFFTSCLFYVLFMGQKMNSNHSWEMRNVISSAINHAIEDMAFIPKDCRLF